MAKRKLEKLTVQRRAKTGKGPNRRLRAQNIVPGVFYNGEGANILVQVGMIPLTKLYSKLGSTQVFELHIEGEDKGEAHPAFMWRFKYDPVKSVPVHVDFYGVDLNKQLRVFVPVEITGKAKGVADDGGILNVFRDTVEVLAKPMDIPEHLIIDVTELGVNDNVMVEDIEMPEGVELTSDENYAVVGVSVPAAEEEEPVEGEEGLEDGEGAEGGEEAAEGGEEAASEE